MKTSPLNGYLCKFTKPAETQHDQAKLYPDAIQVVCEESRSHSAWAHLHNHAGDLLPGLAHGHLELRALGNVLQPHAASCAISDEALKWEGWCT
eukprot:1159148-Pelagomonas_calceolata.AAC.10